MLRWDARLEIEPAEEYVRRYFERLQFVVSAYQVRLTTLVWLYNNLRWLWWGYEEGWS
jgi:hypothetical protein